ncbi:hypothetical protein ACIA7R_30950 [Micromonospora chalcea]
MGRNLWLSEGQWVRLVEELYDLGVDDVNRGKVYADWVSIAVAGGVRELVCFLTVLAAVLDEEEHDRTPEDRAESIRILAEQIKTEHGPDGRTTYYLWKWTVGPDET